MTAHDNAATFQRWFDEGCSQGHVDLADALYAPAYVSHSLGPDFPPTRDGLKQFVRAWHEGMPDVQFPIDDVVAEGDRVAGRLRAQGTHRGSLFGIPATGKPVDVGFMVMARFDKAGQWVEDWAAIDQLGLLQQLGVVPALATT